MVASFGASALIQLVGVLTGVLLARALGPEARGELAAAVLWFVLLTELLSLGLLQANTYEAARDPSSAGRLAVTSVALSVALGLATIGIAFLLLPITMQGYSAEAIESARLLALSAPLSLGALFLIGVLNGLERFKAFHLMRVLYVLVAAVGLLVVAVTSGLTVRSAILCYVAGNAVTFVAAIGLLANERHGSLLPTAQTARALIGFGARSHTSKVATIMNERLPQVVISIAFGAVDLGLFVVALTLRSVVVLVGQSTALVVLPVIARAESDDERREVSRLLVSVSFLATALVAVPLVTVAPQLIDAFFGSAFAGASDVARVLLLAGVLASTNRVLEGVLQGVGRPLDPGLAEAVALVLTALGLGVFLPTLGLLGAGLASLIAYVVSLAFMLRWTARALELPPASLLIVDRSALARIAGLVRRGSGAKE